MDGRPILFILARVFDEHRLEAVLVGNAAAALQGAPVTTIDFDFLFRRTPSNLGKLKAIAKALGATLLKPYYPASDLFRLTRDEDQLQVDFMGRIDGIRSLEVLRRRATRLDMEGHTLLVASLEDVIRSKRAAGRPRDRAVLEIRQNAKGRVSRAAQTDKEPQNRGGAGRPVLRVSPRRPWMKKRKPRLTRREALRLETERALIDEIRRNLALPMDKRTHFLRKRVGVQASCL